jgi:hypothetical protein
MSEDFDIKLQRKLESNAAGAGGGVSEVRRIELITGIGRHRRWSRGLPTMATLMVSAMLAAWLGIWGPIDLEKLKEWQPLIASIVALGAAGLALWAAMIALQKRPPADKPKRDFRPLDLPAWLNAVFTLALAVLAFAAWQAAQGQLKAALDQVAEAREAQRPWLTVDA